MRFSELFEYDSRTLASMPKEERSKLDRQLESFKWMIGKCLDCFSGLFCGCENRVDWNEKKVWNKLNSLKNEWLATLDTALANTIKGKGGAAWAYRAHDVALKNFKDEM